MESVFRPYDFGMQLTYRLAFDPELIEIRALPGRCGSMCEGAAKHRDEQTQPDRYFHFTAPI
jgi:hypothetical protein